MRLASLATSVAFPPRQTPRALGTAQGLYPCQPSDPFQHSKTPRTPNWSFLRAPVRGTEICQTVVEIRPKLAAFLILTLLTDFSPPDWNPQKQSPGLNFGQIWGFRVFLNALKGVGGFKDSTLRVACLTGDLCRISLPFGSRRVLVQKVGAR